MFLFMVDVLVNTVLHCCDVFCLVACRLVTKGVSSVYSYYFIRNGLDMMRGEIDHYFEGRERSLFLSGIQKADFRYPPSPLNSVRGW